MSAVEEAHVSEGEIMEDAEPHGSNSLKRKASPDVDEALDALTKRTRHDDDDDEPARSRRRSWSPDRDYRAREEPPAERRPPVATQEDKKRGKRLFGGLLNTLNQGPSNLQQKRRLEIEKRQQERMQKQDAEDDQRRAERLAELRATRIREQIIFDEEVVGATADDTTRQWTVANMVFGTDAQSTHKEAYPRKIPTNKIGTKDCMS